MSAMRWRTGVGVALGIVAPALIVAACGAGHHDSGATPSVTATATRTVAVSTTSAVTVTTTTAPGNYRGSEGNPGNGDGPNASTIAERPGLPGGTDTCGVTFCGTTENPAPAPGGTDTCGITFCGTTSNPAPTPGGTDTCGATFCGTTSSPAPTSPVTTIVATTTAGASPTITAPKATPTP